MEVIEPYSLFFISPAYSLKPVTLELIIPSPFVSIINSPRYPSSPRVGISKITLAIPSFSTISFMIPRLLPIFSITEPEYSIGTSITNSSYGSVLTPPSSLMITSGWETCISKPSLRIFSSKMAMCNSPRPYTLKKDGPILFTPWSGEKSTLRPTLISNSFSNLSFICLEVTNFPSRPANGESFTKKLSDSVGSSIAM